MSVGRLDKSERLAMLSFAPVFPARRAPRVLCLGAHGDDLEIGVGGTILEIGRRYPAARILWIVMSGRDERKAEAETSARVLLRRFSSVEISVENFRDGFFPQFYGDLKQRFEDLKRLFAPDLIFTHALHDRHQDHRLVSELTWNTWRDTMILEYEIPKYEGDLGSPNVFVPLSKNIAERKVAHLLRFFPSQRSRRWFARETFEGHLRLRGVECNARSGMAESFHGRKICL